MEFTKAQNDAIYKRGGEILVSAAAGSGKTAVLTERVLEFVLGGGSLERLLIVTFTVKAAAQMRERISSAINDKLATCSDNIHLLRESMLIHKAKICTIDSLFCEIVRNNFYQLNISNNFKIADNAEIILLLQMISSNIVDECYETTENFSDVCDLISNDKTDENVTELIINIFRFLQSVPFPKEWIAKALSMYEDENLQDNIWIKFIIDNLKTSLSDLALAYDEQLERLRDFDEINVKFLPIMFYEQSCINELIKLCQKHDFDGIKNKISTIGIANSPIVKGYTDHFEKLRAVGIRLAFKTLIKDLSSSIFDVTTSDILMDIKHLRPIITTIIDVVLKLQDEYTSTISQKNILSFSDISKLALELLVVSSDGGNVVPTNLAIEMASLYDEVLIDEYQDTNDIQDLIFTALSNNRKNLFVVGDIRQSIYSFRGACPEIFLNKQKIATVSEDEFPCLINLSNNFRSRKEVLSFINFFFGSCMSDSVGSVDYSKSQELIASASYPNDSTKITEISILKSKPVNSAEDDDTSSMQNEAKYIANKIAQMLKEEYTVFDIKKNCYRVATPSDFVILLRDLKNASNIYTTELLKVGVAIFCESTTSYFESYEIRAVISILSAIDNPYDDISLAASLRCPCFGFSNDDLIDIRANHPKLCFYDALKLKSKTNEKYENILKTFDFLRVRARELPIYRFLMLIINELSLMRVFCGMGRGETRQNNLNQLCRYAKTYEDSGTRGLYGFISFINKVIESKGDLSPVNPMPSNNFVSILTIHKSKGLEFPIVFLAGIGKQFNTSISKEKFFLDKDFGIGSKIRDINMGIEFSTTAYEAIKQSKKAKQISEEMRVFYVAATRAMDKLFIVFSCNNIKKLVYESSMFISSNGSISKSYLEGVNSPSKWLITALAQLDEVKNKLDFTAENAEILAVASNLKINIISNIYDSQAIVSEETPKTDTLIEDVDLKEELYNRLMFRYAKDEFHKVPSKITVSEIKSNLLDDNSKMLYDELSFIKPAFLNENPATQIGTAIHKILQYADNEKCKDIVGLNDILKSVLNNHIITKTVYDMIKRPSLLKFFNSQLVFRMNNATQLFKEYRFTVMLPIEDYFKITKTQLNITDETILLQGVIDCFFIENNKIILIDYKTDYFLNENELLEKYKIQLELYKKSLELIFNIEVSEMIIYSFYKDKEIYF